MFLPNKLFDRQEYSVPRYYLPLFKEPSLELVKSKTALSGVYKRGGSKRFGRHKVTREVPTNDPRTLVISTFKSTKSPHIKILIFSSIWPFITRAK